MLVSVVQLPPQLPHLQYSTTTGVHGFRQAASCECPLDCSRRYTSSPTGEAAEPRRIPVRASSKTDRTPARSTLPKSVHRAYSNCTSNLPSAMMQCRMHMKMFCRAMRRAWRRNQHVAGYGHVGGIAGGGPHRVVGCGVVGCSDKDMKQMGAIWRDNLQVWLPRIRSYFVSPSSRSNLNVQNLKNLQKPAQRPKLCFLNFKKDS